MFKSGLGLASLALLASCVTAPQISPAARSDLTPTGKLRVGISYGNPVLVQKDPATGDPVGVAIDVSRELARRIGASVEFVTYEVAGRLADAVKSGAWDVAFLAVDPERAAEIDFTAGCLEFEFTYLVPAGSTLRAIGDVDREGVRVALSVRSAYDLYLTRSLQRARIARATSVDASVQLFIKDRLEAVAGAKPLLMTYAERLPGSRVLDGRFMTGELAMGTPKGRAAGARYLREFNEDVKASGLVARAIERYRLRGVAVAPKASAH